MSKLINILFSLLLTNFVYTYGQSEIWLKGRIINQNDSTPVALAQIASYRKQFVYAADSLGCFTVSLPADDSLKIVALGFEPRIFQATDTLFKEGEWFLFPLQSTSYMIQQVDINHYSLYNEYNEQLKAIHSKAQQLDLKMPADIIMGKGSEVPIPIRPVFRKNPPLIILFYNPLIYVYYHTGKSQKEKRKLVKIFYEEKTRQLLTPELIQEVSGFKGEKLQQFIVYCNVNAQLTDKDSNDIIKGKIYSLYIDFTKQER